MERKTLISLLISFVLVGGTLYILSSASSFRNSSDAQNSQNIEVRDGVQYVTVTAKNGYSPRMTQIKSGIPTKLIVKTSGTYDCSASLVVRTVGFQKILQPTGAEVVDLGIPKPGENVRGVCGMGMYSFQLQSK